MKNILHELYRGNIPGWDSQSNAHIDSDAFHEKLASERKYFASIMSKKDFERFTALEKFHKESHAVRYKKVYTHAFKLGVLLMCAVFMGEETD